MKNTLNRSFKYIKREYEKILRNDNIKPASAEEWLADNFYMIEDEAKAVMESQKGEKKLLQQKKSVMLSYAYEYLRENTLIVNETDVFEYLSLKQKKRAFSLLELEAFPDALKTALICEMSNTALHDAVKMSNIIKSLFAMREIDWKTLFEDQSIIDKILSSDKVYSDMDENSKNFYRKSVANIAKKVSLSEEEVASAAISICKNKSDKKGHVGYYLFDEGKNILYEHLGKKLKKKYFKELYFVLIAVLTLFLLVPFYFYTKSFIGAILVLLPILDISINLVNNTILKVLPQRYVPRLKPEKTQNTPLLVIYPVLLGDTSSAEKMCQNMEVAYLANRREKIYFSIVGDFRDSKRSVEETDDKIIEVCRKKISALNEKYGEHFFLLHRERTFNPVQKKWLGRERKRGAIEDLNRFLKGKYNFKYTEGNVEKLLGIKYVLTLDADTFLPKEAAEKLLGAMLHPLSAPHIKNGVVKSGYAIMEPRISTELLSSNKSFFASVYAGQGGVDTYSVTVPDVYTDLFCESIFTGKGIYDVDAFAKCMDGKIPDNRVLSHDLLESCFCRCALVSDVEVYDGFPHRFYSYATRLHRWIRGDWQIFSWLFNKKLSPLSKWKIFDNMRRSINPVIQTILILLGCSFLSENAFLYIFTALFSLILPLLLYLADALISKSFIYIGSRVNSDIVYGFRACLYQCTLSIVLLGYTAYLSLSAILLGIYRQIVPKNALEWVTAADSDKGNKNSLGAYYSKMIASPILSLMLLPFCKNGIAIIFALIFAAAPGITWLVSREKKDKTYRISDKQKEKLYEISARIWRFFDRYMNEGENYLPPDNVQINPYKGVAHRTSPTNIGFGMLSIMCAHDLDFISREEMVCRISKMIKSIETLEKWRGHLYNWYDTVTLKPLNPKYVSTVDSGNLVCYILTVAAGLYEYGEKALAQKLEKIAEDTSFAPLYSEKKELFSIGYNVTENRLSNSYYDLLASEARTASFIAIAKGDIKQKHWFTLGRSLTASDSYKGLVSWTGTMFEYLMPNIIMEKYKNTLLSESSWFCLYCQKKYGKKRHIPWGVSESGYYSFDAEQNYQYKAFGIPSLGLKRGLSADAVIAPYATALALMEDTEGALSNMGRLEKLGAFGEYGFFESIDFNPEEISGYGIVKSYMAHHQGMSLASITNVLKDNLLKKRFHSLPLVRSAEPLLKERIPVKVRLTKEYKERLQPIKAQKTSFEECVREYENKLSPPPLHILSNGSYNLLTDTEGGGYSSIGNIRLNKFWHDNERQSHLLCVRRDGQTLNAYGGKVIFTDHKAEYLKKGENLSLNTTLCVLPDINAETRRLTVINEGEDCEVEVYFYMETSLTTLSAQMAHNAFSNMFIKTENIDNVFYVQRSKEGKEKNMVAYALPLIEGECKSISFTQSREEFLGRQNSFMNADAFGKELLNTPSLDPCIAYKAVLKIKKGESASITFAMGMEETRRDAEKAVNIIKAMPPSEAEHKAFKAVHSAMPYLTVDERNKAFLLLPQIIWGSVPSTEKQRALQQRNYNINELWSIGVSGDYPIILVSLSDTENISYLEQIIKIHKYFLRRTITNDLVIICNTADGYTNPLEETVKKKAGNLARVWIVKDKALTDALLSKSSVYIDLTAGFSNLKRGEVIPYKEKANKTFVEGDLTPDYLEFQNEWGGFSESDYVIYLQNGKRTPAPWINVIANKDFGFIASENGGGYTWYQNCNEKRITAWQNDELLDMPTEKLVICENDDCWSPMSGVFEEKGNFLIRHAFGFTEYSRITRNISHKITEFVPLSEPIKIIKAEIENMRDSEVRLKISYSLTPVLGENSFKTRGHKSITPLKNGVSVENVFSSFKMYLVSGNGKSEIFDKISGKRISENCAGYETEISVFEEITLKPHDKKTVVFSLGAGDEKVLDVNEEFKKVKEYYKNLFEILKVDTPSKSMNLMLNGRLMYQSLSSRLFARTGFYQSGGAFGFRDQLQDSMAFMYSAPEIAKEQILLHASHQFLEGDVLHWWHEGENPKGVRTRISDDRLWLPYLVSDYIKITGDNSILNCKAPYVSAPVLGEGEDERYAEVAYSGEGTIKEHCEKAINISKTEGKHSLPLIGTGDWNDGMNNVCGESVWLAWFMSVILKNFGFDNKKLKEAAESAWDGEWYKRAYYEDGIPIGSKESDECKIDSITQSWAVFAEAKHGQKAMESVREKLVDTENKLIKILDPPFKNSTHNPGYIKDYPEGVRENGGQYTHAAVWVCIAEAVLGNTENALKLFEIINPINKKLDVYKKEPYALSADVYSAKEFYGRGGWSWYTGAASWLYRAGVEHILGFKKEGDKISFKPCVPKSWDKFSISYKFMDTMYIFNLSKGDNKTGSITLLNDKKTHKINVIY